MGKLNRPKPYGIIYKIENKINGQIYIGQTKQRIQQRINSHKRNNKNHIGLAIRKYGIQSFSISTIDIANSKQEIDEKEKFWIKFHNSKTPYGYNLTDGGDGGDCCSGKPKTEEHKQKLRESNIGQTRSEQTKKNISDSKRKPKPPSQLCQCGCGKMAKAGNKYIHGHNFRNKHHTEEANKKNSENHKGKGAWNKGKRNCFSQETINRMSEKARQRIGSDRFNYGKHMSKESVNKMKETKKEEQIMPCYQIRKVEISFKAGNIDLLKKAIEKVGWSIVGQNADSINIRNIAYAKLVNINMKTQTISSSQFQEIELAAFSNALKRSYSECVIDEIARKQKWIKKKLGENRFQLQRF